MPPGELMLIRAFYLHETEEREKLLKSGKVFPVVPL